jgi:hypothetical protein
MRQQLQEWLQAMAWVAAAVAAVVAAFKFRSELRLGREQRDRELRWKQAEAGKSLNDEMLADALAVPALRMLDYDGRSFTLPSGRPVVITHDDLRIALNPEHRVADDNAEKEQYICDCFDSLFYFMSTLEHYIQSSLILPEDVAFPLEYYVPLLATFRSVVEEYLDRYRLHKATAFLHRYQAWVDAR